MRQLQIKSYGPIEDAVAFEDVAKPDVGDSDVLVRVHAASINPIDYKIAAGALQRIQQLKFPAPFGFDCCGTVEAIGREVKNFAPGDRIYTRLPREKMGSFAEYTVVDAKYAAMAPPSLSDTECASLPLVALTTIQALVDRAHAEPDQSLLVHAGSGGVGTFAVQYAKHVLGLHVTTTTSSRNIEWVAGLGADIVVAYDKQDYRTLDARYDIVFDTLGGDTTKQSFGVLKRGGVVISIAGPPDRYFAGQVGAGAVLSLAMRLMGLPIELRAFLASGKYFRFLTESSGFQLEHVAQVVAENKVHAVIDSVFPFDQAIEALEHAAKGRAKGKVVIEMGDKEG